MTKDEALKLALEALENNRQTHHYCEDTWYSCPKHEDGCANESEGDECNCGADKANAEIDKAITAIKEALMSVPDGAQPAVTESHKQEPEYVTYAGNGTAGFLEGERPTGFFFKTPPQPEQEPVAQCTESDSWNCKYCCKTESCKALQDPRNFASPPQRTWVGLTDEEQQAAYDAWQQKDDGWGSFYDLIEAKLKEKNT